mmetsp:Transcript_9646/g.9440  ORF Transcript_9646/g.9440 Transcript_9646/m.9440 type:complete len:893 (-) Transcript_9646:375-3053(-)
MKFATYFITLSIVCIANVSALVPTKVLYKKSYSLSSTVTPPTDEITPKTVTAEIMQYFNTNRGTKSDPIFQKRLSNVEVRKNLDGLHIITILFQSARSKRMAKNLIPIRFLTDRLSKWDREWSERDISMFVYGVRSLEGLDEGDLLRLGAKKISESKAFLTSRAIGNALYGLQEITSDTDGAAELLSALADKIEAFTGDLNGQDIGIGMYGLQGMNADCPEVKKMITVMSKKIAASESVLDSQAISNALYGLQSMSSDSMEVCKLVSTLAVKVSESVPDLSAQAIGSALYGLQKLSSDRLEVRTLVATLAEKLEQSNIQLDAQAVGNSLYGLQRMKSNSPEVRALVQTFATKLLDNKVALDGKGIGTALYGLHSMSTDVPQVRSLLSALAGCIFISDVSLSGQGIADSLYGLSGMNRDCPELRSLLSALAERIDATSGKLDSQEIGNALYGLQGLSSDMVEARLIAGKLAEKLKRSKAVMLSQHIARAMLGLQRLGPETVEVRFLMKQLAKRISESDRTRMTSTAIADSIFGLQGMTSNVPEVQELAGQLAKKVSASAVILTPSEIGRALFGLQGLSSSASLIQESAIGLDSDEVQFLLSTLWDKVKLCKTKMTLEDIALGMQGIIQLRDPIAENLRQYMYYQVMTMDPAECGIKYVIKPEEVKVSSGPDIINTEELEEMNTFNDENNDSMKIVSQSKGIIEVQAVTNEFQSSLMAPDIIAVVRSLRLNNLKIPKWIALEYNAIENRHPSMPIVPQSRMDKIVAQRFKYLYPNAVLSSNVIMDGFRLDLSFPEIKLNVELDGPSHRYPARARFDRARDRYMGAKGFEVMRLQLIGRSVDDLVSQIIDRVDLRSEQQKDTEIQSLYLADASVLYTPEAARKIYSPRKNLKNEL